MNYYIGVDIGGTNIVSAVVDENCKILSKAKIKTISTRPYSEILPDIISVILESAEEADISVDEIQYIGIGCPGTINSDTGVVVYSNNIKLYDIPLGSDICKAFGKPVYVDNDANAAAFGEFLAGAAKGTHNAVVITLGTGVGSGIIIDGNIYRGGNYAGAEFGHTVICVDGYPCSCGRAGCFEAYCSIGGIVRMTREAMNRYPNSIMHEYFQNDGRLSARTAFRAKVHGDTAGGEVVEKYINHLACGITNALNIFQPDILCIGGGICNEGDNLLQPLRRIIAENNFVKNEDMSKKLVVCTLNNDAGIIGAAMLGKSKKLLNDANKLITNIV